jgi:Glycosyltransferases involved in cell wall biogenesis
MQEIEPLLSIVTITYNQEPFISEAIKGILMQKTNFPVEYIIAEDCSTDKTREIIEKYQTQHNKIIRLITSNQNVGAIANEHRALLESRGKYIAFCEGDDYWTDPYKLQKQVDFLESHINYSVCFHRYKILDNELNQYRNDKCGFLFTDKSRTGIDVDTKLFLNHWITQPVTMVFRKECFDLSIIHQYKYFRDMHLIYHLLQKGNGHLLSFEGAVYREHLGGIHGKQSEELQCQIGVSVAQELYKYNNTKLTKDYYLQSLDWAIGFSKKNKKLSKGLITHMLIYFFTSHSFNKLAKHIFKWR